MLSMEEHETEASPSVRGVEVSTSSKESALRYESLAKVVVIGDGGVGKTSLITRFTEDRFVQSYVATIGVDFRSKVLSTSSKTIKLQIWDTAGQERFRNITQAYYRGASAIILAFSLLDLSSFESIEKWLGQIEQTPSHDSCKILVGCKSDDRVKRVVERGTAEKLAARMGIPYLQCSSKSGRQVQYLFQFLGQQLVNKSRSQNKIKKIGLITKQQTTTKRCLC